LSILDEVDLGEVVVLGVSLTLIYPAVANVPVAEPVYWPGALHL
jgi:hypothetical protein